jgi:DNA-binding GntR family transcriptional regulator
MAFGPFPIPFKLDRTRNASVQVYEHLRELITSLILVPGSHLDRAEMCAYFELSSTPVRDALTRLSEEGLMDIFKQQATIVSVIDADAIAEAHFLRCAMELEVVDVLARQRDPTLINTLESFISQQAFANARNDFDTFVRLLKAAILIACNAYNPR